MQTRIIPPEAPAPARRRKRWDGSLQSSGGSVAGAASLSSLDTLTAAGTVAISGSAALASLSTLAATGIVTEEASASLASVSTLSAAGTVSVSGAASLASVDTLSATGAVAGSGAAALVSVDTLAAAGSVSVRGNASLVSLDTLTAAGTVSVRGAAALVSLSTLAAAGTVGPAVGPKPGLPIPLYVVLRRRSFLSAPPAPVANDLIEALRTRLVGTASLSQLTDVYNRLAKRAEAYPFLVINMVGEVPEITTDRDVTPSWAEVQFSVIDQDDARGLALAWAAWQSLAPNNSAPLVFNGGADSGGHVPGMIREIRMTGTGRGGPACWSFMFTYRFYLTRPLHP